MPDLVTTSQMNVLEIGQHSRHKTVNGDTLELRQRLQPTEQILKLVPVHLDTKDTVRGGGLLHYAIKEFSVIGFRRDAPGPYKPLAIYGVKELPRLSRDAG